LVVMAARPWVTSNWPAASPMAFAWPKPARGLGVRSAQKCEQASCAHPLRPCGDPWIFASSYWSWNASRRSLARPPSYW
jgi:hypothetical protein